MSKMLEPVPSAASDEVRTSRYAELKTRLASLLEGETDLIAAMATVACELHHAFEDFHWTGFYRAVPEGAQTLVIGPYQGGHGCLRIPFERGVCGAAARALETQLVPDVDAFPGHIACASTTRSEIVVPVVTPSGTLLGVLDVDSDREAAFDVVDRLHLESICADLGRRYPRPA
jgi:GAF domain-containing protein